MLPRNWAIATEARTDTDGIAADPVVDTDAVDIPVDDTTDPVVEVTDDLPADTMPDAEVSEADIADQAIDADMDTGDRLASDISDLQVIHSVVSDSIGDGGAEESARRVIDVAVESFCKRWDIPHVKVGNESLSSSKMIRTRVACESIGEAITKGFAALVAWIKEICKKIGAWFKGLFTLVGKLESRLKGLEAVIDHLGDKNGKFSVGGNENLHFNGKVDPDAIANYASRMGDHTKSMVQDTVDTIWVQRSDLISKYRDGGLTKLKAMWAWDKSLYTTVKRIIADYGLDEKAYKGVCPMPGENYLFMFEHEGKTRVQYIHGKIVADKNSIALPAKDKLVAALKAAATYVHLYKERTSDSHEFVTKLESLESMLETAVKAQSDAKEAGAKEVMQESVKNLRQTLANSQSIQRGMVAGLRAGALGLLDYVSAGVHAYGTIGKAASANDKADAAAHSDSKELVAVEAHSGSVVDPFANIEPGTKLYKTQPATSTQIKAAEHQLNRKFADSYVAYISKYGAVSFGSTELTGLNVSKHCNVVEMTEQEMKLNNDFPKDAIVLENIGMEGSFMLINTAGHVYQWPDGRGAEKYNSLNEYVQARLKHK